MWADYGSLLTINNHYYYGLSNSFRGLFYSQPIQLGSTLLGYSQPKLDIIGSGGLTTLLDLNQYSLNNLCKTI